MIETGEVAAENAEGTLTSGQNLSYWLESAQPLEFETLTAGMACDVVIVGGGIAGITTAYCLSRLGKQVVVVEDGFVGSGETGRTTAHLVTALDDRYTYLERLFGEKTPLIAESHATAIDFIEDTISKEGIQCNFSRLHGYLFRHPSDDARSIDEEYEATKRAGLLTELLSTVPGIPTENGPCLKFDNQAQFHPMKYLKGLCAAILNNGGKIFTRTHADKIDKEGVTCGDFRINAKHIVVATNTPVNNLVSLHTKQFPYRTYVIGVLLPKTAVEPALWWDTGNFDSKWLPEPYHYVRTAEYDENNYLLICGGEDHKTGQGDDEGITEDYRYERLEVWARDRFHGAGEVIYRWSGQVMEPVDSLAFMGRNPGDENIYVITGDSGNGMTYCTIGGILVTDLITGIPNKWEELYSPSRFSIKATGDFMKEIGNMVAQYADYVEAGDIETANDLMPGNGAVVNTGLKKVALYRDDDGTLHAYSAVCPHLGCILQWNGDEKSFDCPCHGSRFTCGGDVVNGPAKTHLKRIEIKRVE